MQIRRWSPLAPMLALAGLGCQTGLDQAEPTPPGVTVVAAPARSEPPPEDRARHERLAARMARALRDSDFRRTVFEALAQSPYREHKIELQGFLAKGGGRERLRFGRLAQDPDASVQDDLDRAGSVEVYLPVPAHRQAWQGGTDLIVATAELDGDAPVGFDLFGRRIRLDPKSPPSTPVLMVSRAEQVFGPAAEAGICILDCSGGSTGSGGTGSPIPGLYLTRTQFTDTFESWFKGDPEFEIHILGQDGSTKALTTYQCIGEHAPSPYNWDQNAMAWSGNVLLFSNTQFDLYNKAHPGQNVRVFVLEDDDTACQIKVDSTRATRLFGELKTAYGNFTGGKDSTGIASVVRFFRRAFVLYDLFAAAASFIKTDDDIVGNAVADSVAASAFFPNANWIVRGENSLPTGALRLEMR